MTTPPWPLNRSYRHAALCVRGHEFAWGTRTFIMGIINVTPDSFSGDGIAGDVPAAVALARAQEAAGARILDIGGESTRPDAHPLAPDEELRRVLPALTAIRGVTDLPISIDTMHAAVAEAALSAGADILNDISGLRHDPDIAAVAAGHGAPVVAMHNQRGRPFHDVAGDIAAGLETSLQIAAAAGIQTARIILDPGFGFGWKPEQNLEMIRRLPDLWDVGLPLLLGPSRKSTLGFVTGAPVDQRLGATAAAVAVAIAAGVDIVRVHDVADIVQAVQIADGIVRDNWRSE
ncbi:MAG TPA: dihydropteroate synthase [Tepidiformaceae bacterium]|nr:dihydropteroate synthase [Tepidiformaceae bacterium]